MADNDHQDQGVPNRKSQRSRYWSLLLVGDHGRIIPFRRFKGIAYAFCGVLIFALIALTALSFLYWRQTGTVAQLTVQLVELQKQADGLQDERDMLLARLVIENKLPIMEEPEQEPISSADTDPPSQSVSTTQVEMPSTTEVPENPSMVKDDTERRPVIDPPKKSGVKLGARISHFQANYDRGRSALQAQFRISNDNQPKEPLTGRVVVIFKNEEDPPLKWISVPRVQIANDLPEGKLGELFTIRNYRTMTLRAQGPAHPFSINTVEVFVFATEGDLIVRQAHAVTIAVDAGAGKERDTSESQKPQESIKPLTAKESIDRVVEEKVQEPEMPSSLPVVPGADMYPDPYSDRKGDS